MLTDYVNMEQMKNANVPAFRGALSLLCCPVSPCVPRVPRIPVHGIHGVQIDPSVTSLPDINIVQFPNSLYLIANISLSLLFCQKDNVFLTFSF